MPIRNSICSFAGKGLLALASACWIATAQRNASTTLGIVLSQKPAAVTVATTVSEIDIVVSLGRPPGDVDVDGDGFTGNGGDCNDSNAAIHPGVFDIPGDGIDQN